MMKRILFWCALSCLLAQPSFAARVYLKEGGYIEAKKIWRTPGKVHVLVNRDTMTEFSTGEIDLKRTFGRPKAAPARKGKAAAGHVSQQGRTVDRHQELGNSPGPAKPDSGAPSTENKSEGIIRKHKKEMMERVNE